MTKEIKEVTQGYKINEGSSYIPMSHWDARKAMATARQIDYTYRVAENGTRIYNDPEAARRHNMTFSSARPMRSEAEILKENQLIKDELDYNNAVRNNKENNNEISPREVTTSSSSNYIGQGKNADISPLFFKIACRNMEPSTLNSSNNKKDMNVMTENEIADLRLAEHVAADLRSNELATGNEYSSSDLEKIIRTRFANINENFLQVVLNMILNDVENMRSRVAGTFPEFKVLVSIRSADFW